MGKKIRCNVPSSQKVLGFLKKRLLAILTIVGILLGFAVGLGLRLLKLSENELMWLGFAGEIFISLLKLPIIPLIVSSVISATGGMDIKKNGKLGLLFFALHIASNALGTGFGVILGATIKPGQTTWIDSVEGVGVGNETFAQSQTKTAKMETQDIAADMLRNLFPENLVRATFQKKVTKYDVIEEVQQNELNGTVISYKERKRVDYADSINVIGLIFACTVFGLAAASTGPKGKAMLAFFDSSTATILVILGWFLWATPVGVFSLIAASVAAIEDLWGMFVKLGLFVGAVLLGLFIKQVIVFPSIYLLLTRRNPFKVHLANLKGLCVGFAAVSSAAAMPYMFEACKKLKIDDRVTSFGVPLSVTVNASGSSVFIGCSVLFMAQLNHIALDPTQLLTLFVLTSVSSFALPAAPSASIVLIVIFSTTLGVPVDKIALLFAMEWLLDRVRTAANVGTEMMIISATWHCIKKEFLAKEGNEESLDEKPTSDVETVPLNGDILNEDSSSTVM